MSLCTLFLCTLKSKNDISFLVDQYLKLNVKPKSSHKIHFPFISHEVRFAYFIEQMSNTVVLNHDSMRKCHVCRQFSHLLTFKLILTSTYGCCLILKKLTEGATRHKGWEPPVWYKRSQTIIFLDIRLFFWTKRKRERRKIDYISLNL